MHSATLLFVNLPPKKNMLHLYYGRELVIHMCVFSLCGPIHFNITKITLFKNVLYFKLLHIINNSYIFLTVTIGKLLYIYYNLAR